MCFMLCFALSAGYSGHAVAYNTVAAPDSGLTACGALMYCGDDIGVTRADVKLDISTQESGGELCYASLEAEYELQNTGVKQAEAVLAFPSYRIPEYAQSATSDGSTNVTFRGMSIEPRIRYTYTANVRDGVFDYGAEADKLSSDRATGLSPDSVVCAYTYRLKTEGQRGYALATVTTDGSAQIISPFRFGDSVSDRIKMTGDYFYAISGETVTIYSVGGKAGIQWSFYENYASPITLAGCSAEKISETSVSLSEFVCDKCAIPDGAEDSDAYNAFYDMLTSCEIASGISSRRTLVIGSELIRWQIYAFTMNGGDSVEFTVKSHVFPQIDYTADRNIYTFSYYVGSLFACADDDRSFSVKTGQRLLECTGGCRTKATKDGIYELEIDSDCDIASFAVQGDRYGRAGSNRAVWAEIVITVAEMAFLTVVIVLCIKALKTLYVSAKKKTK